MESEEDTPLLDEDENCDEETKSTKVTQSPPQYVRTRTKHFHYSVKRCMDNCAKNRETGVVCMQQDGIMHKPIIK